MAVDDMGHGNSSPLEKCPVFSESVEEVEELLNALEIENSMFSVILEEAPMHYRFQRLCLNVL